MSRRIGSTRLVLGVILALLAASAAGCGTRTAGTDDRTGVGVGARVDVDVGEITVLAAASLTEAFTALADAFTDAHPGTSVTLGFGASSTLVRQVLEGAPADVFASADVPTMQRLADAGLAAGEPITFATNGLAIIVPRGNPAGIGGLVDLARPDVAVVTCAPDVPIGRYSAELLARAGVEVTPRSLEENVKAVVTKVTLGEADAGIVYATDVVAAGSAAEGVEVPAELDVVARYPIAVTTGAGDADLAAAFVAFVTGPEGRRVLRDLGFGAP